MQIKVAERLEGTTLVPFVTKCWLALVKEGLWDKTEVLVDGELKVLVALDGRKRIGCLTWHEDSPGAATVNLAYVVPSYRRQGIYKALQEELIAYATRQGLKKVISITKPYNEAVKRAKEARGFKLTSVQYELDLSDKRA